MYRSPIRVVSSCVVLSWRVRITGWCLTGLIAILCVLSTAGGSAAGTLAYTGVGVSTTTSADELTIGFSFTPTSNIVVDSLGVEDVGGDGLEEAHPVGIWRDSDQTLLTSVTVPAGLAATFDSGWRFAPTTPAALLSGVAYRIGVYRSDGSLDAYSFGGPVVTAAEIFRGSDVFISPFAGLTYPTSTDAAVRSVANFTFVVPEPSGLTLAALGLLGFSFGSWRRRRRAA